MKLFPIEYLYLCLIHPHFEIDYFIHLFYSSNYEEVRVCVAVPTLILPSGWIPGDCLG